MAKKEREVLAFVRKTKGIELKEMYDKCCPAFKRTFLL